MSDKKHIGCVSLSSLSDCIDFKKLSKKLAGMGKYKDFSIYIETNISYCTCIDSYASYDIFVEGKPKARKPFLRRRKKK